MTRFRSAPLRAKLAYLRGLPAFWSLRRRFPDLQLRYCLQLRLAGRVEPALFRWDRRGGVKLFCFVTYADTPGWAAHAARVLSRLAPSRASLSAKTDRTKKD